MQSKDKIVAVGLFTEAEFKRWGSRLGHMCHVEERPDFDDLLKAIDEVDVRWVNRHEQ